ncbi:hypothetical protein BCR39DRAFT_585399 [Naematelia encephala]|uniref:Protein kinase domain-containing protein n=1 Tax=Naematelia encephala TaxID=71784 RepID=A0A1Y2BM98_9TREE|nr:hypothetical protein BCR39DRAFT_585399 [Naematelia encephala]
MTGPPSPQVATHNSAPDVIAQSSASGSKSRKVRLFAGTMGDDFSSDEEGALTLERGQDGDAYSSHLRQSSYSGPTNTSPTSRISSIVNFSRSKHPKLQRASTASSSISAHSEPSGSYQGNAEAGPSNPYHDWKIRYRLGRKSSLRSGNAGGRGRTKDDGGRLDRGVGRMDGVGDDYYHGPARLDHLDDSGSEREDGDRRGIIPVTPPVVAPITPVAAADSAEGRERLEWQSMLASVLEGEVLTEETSRIGEDNTSEQTFRKELGQSLWWQIRARMRGRTEAEEKRRVEERRSRVVDPVLEEIERFLVKSSPGPMGVGRRLSAEETAQSAGENEISEEDRKEQSEVAALDQVVLVLEKLGVIEALYPHAAAFRQAKALYNSETFQARVSALSAWSTVVTSLQQQLHILQKWTGSDDLDVTRPNTTQEKALVGKSRYHPLDAKAKAQAQAAIDQVADDSTFLERIMKEDNLQKTFGKRIFVDLMILIQNAKQTVISHLPLFEELKLPDFQYELVRLIGFPGKLIIEALKIRLDAAAKLVDPNPMVINDMIDNFRLIMSLAVLIKREYEENVEPDPQERWRIPPCLAPDYDAVLLDGLRTFFKLLHWKLKSGSRAMYFRETEVLEDEWEFLYEAAEAVPGGDLVVAEHFCSLTNKLMVRVCNYFDTQLHVPVLAKSTSRATLRKFQQDIDGSKEKRPMTPDEMFVWYGKILDAVRMRYRKLQRFARRLTQRFDNSSEYSLEDEDLDIFVHQMLETGHFLVYTQVFEERGTYIMADGSLWNDPDYIRQLLTRAFSMTLSTSRPRDQNAEQAADEPQVENGNAGGSINGNDDEDQAGYLLLLSPRQNFAWTGAVMTLDLPYIDFALEDNRIRLIADGPMSRLALCRRWFAEALVDPETNEPALTVKCVVEQQAHLPRLHRELRKIARSNYRLTESFIESAAHVRKTLRGTTTPPDMVQNWFVFASEQAKRYRMHVEASIFPRFSRLCMRLAISWVSFICDSCDPTDRKTFRWTVSALRFALEVTHGRNILHLESNEFSLLRKSVASLVSLLISHFDVLGARSSMEAKKEADRLEAMRRLQRLQESIDDDFMPRATSPSGHKAMVERSIRLVREERLRLIAELEAARTGLSADQHLTGQVLDEQVSEDRALVFLAASSSNIALRWQQGAFIGGGANGNVYIGFNLDSGGVMAVKEIRVQDLSNSPTLYKQIKDESDVMSILQHPNIVEYYGIEVHRDRVFIFQEYCEGGSLANQLEHGRIEDEDVVVLYTLQMLQGLEYLHSKGVEHRDVKPENILLGYNSVIKYVDFGASKVITKGNRTMAKTRAIRSRAMGAEGPAVMNSLAGTPMYMAPEVIRATATDREARLGASDIWSMGCVVLEITTGRKPWQHLDNEWAIMFHIGISQDHPPLPNASELSPLGVDFIEQCFILDPAERPSATELLQHPWLAPMLQQMTEHLQDTSSSSGGGPSATSTVVDQYEQAAVVAKMAEMAQRSDGAQQADDLGSFSYTPPSDTTPQDSAGIMNQEMM